MLQVLINCTVLGHMPGLWPLIATRLHGQWAFCSSVSQDRCSFRSSGKLGLGPRGWLKRPIHSHSTQQHSWPLETASVTGSANLRKRMPWHQALPPPQSQSWEERSAQSVGLRQVSWPLPFSLRTRAMWCSGGFLVLVLEKETAVGSL